MGRSVTVLLVTGLLLASLFAVGATTAPSAQEAATDEANGTPTITVTGTGEATAEPDRAVVHLAMTGTGENSTQAAGRLATNASTLRDALQTSALVGDVQSTGIEIREAPVERPPEPTRGGDREEQQFLARQTFDVEVTDPDDAGPVIDLALANGASEVRGVAFTLSEERHDEVRTVAIDRAVTDAERQATAIAESAALTVGPVRSIRSGERRPQPVHRAETDAATAGTEVDVRDVTVHASVEVTYEAGTQA